MCRPYIDLRYWEDMAILDYLKAHPTIAQRRLDVICQKMLEEEGL